MFTMVPTDKVCFCGVSLWEAAARDVGCVWTTVGVGGAGAGAGMTGGDKSLFSDGGAARTWLEEPSDVWRVVASFSSSKQDNSGAKSLSVNHPSRGCRSDSIAPCEYDKINVRRVHMGLAGTWYHIFKRA